MRKVLVVCAVVALVAAAFWYAGRNAATGGPVGSSRPLDAEPGPPAIRVLLGAASAPTKTGAGEATGDAFDQALAASRTSDPVRIYSWLEKTRECLGLSAVQDDLLVFIAGGVSNITGERSEKRRIAVETLVRSCSDFSRAGKPKVSALYGTLSARASEIAPNWAAGANKGALFASAVNYLKSSDTALVDVGVERLLGSVELDVSEHYEDVALLAMLGVACDLGVDCSSRGEKMVKLCALSGVCDGDWTTHLTSQLDSQGRARFTDIRRQYLEWIQFRLKSENVAGSTFKVDESGF